MKMADFPHQAPLSRFVIPAFAGMTEPESLVVAQIINTQVFSKECS